MFGRLFNPRWEHPDPRVRREALESGRAPAEVVAKAAREDEDSSVRRCAVARLDDLDLLVSVAASEAVPDIRETALRRRRELLAGPLQTGSALQSALDALRRAGSPELCVFLAREAQVVEIRTAALQQVNDASVLCAVAIEDPVAAVRRAALERIDDPQAWERVARDTRNRDKQLSRLARERLNAWRKDCSDREDAERLCREMEDLLAGTLQAGDMTCVRRLDGQLNRLADAVAPQLLSRYQHARKQAITGIERLAALQNERRGLCEALEHLLTGMTDAGNDGSAPKDHSAVLEETIKRWQALSHEARANDDEPLARRFSGLVEQIRNASSRLENDRACAVPLQALVQRARELTQEQAEIDARQIKQLERRWASLEQPAAVSLASALQQDFDSALQALRARLDGQRKQRMTALETAEHQLAELDAALQQGELERALSLRNRVRHQLKTAKGVEQRRQQALQQRLEGMQPRLEELRQWRQWGDGDARLRLCTEIETLADSELSAADVASRVRTARDAWKRIDHAEGPAGEELWQRFDQACTRAYEPYQRERSEQAARRARHLEQKQVLCRELDAFEHDTDWKQVDWHAADQRVRKARQHWRSIGPVPGKARRALEKDFHEVLERLESHLDTERQRELRRRRALIAEVEQLATAPDSRGAGRVVKQAQAQWRPTVAAAPKVERVLWKQFRTVCDAVYDHIKGQRKAADATQRANLQRKTDLCTELEALLENGAVDSADVAQRFAKARSEWAETGPIHSKQERSMQARFESLEQRLAQRREQEAVAAAEMLLQGLQARSGLCERLEAALQDTTLETASRQALLQETMHAWQALEPLDARYGQVMHDRFELAGRALEGDAQAIQLLRDGLSVNLETCLSLCLRMEIAAGIDSPAEFAEARMRYQVSRIANAMQHKLEEQQSGQDRLQELQMAWYQVGPVPVEAQASLTARFKRAIEATGMPADSLTSTVSDPAGLIPGKG